MGLCKKAGKLYIGEDPCGDAVKKNAVCVILTATDAAVNTLKRADTYSYHSKAPHLRLNVTKAELGGMFGRASCAICAIGEPGFASAIAQKVANVPGNLEKAQKLVERYENIKKRKNKNKKGGGDVNGDRK